MTSQQKNMTFGAEFLDGIVEWIGRTLDPEDVFSDSDLENWARLWAKEQEEWIDDPDKWALENGYIKE